MHKICSTCQIHRRMLIQWGHTEYSGMSRSFNRNCWNVAPRSQKGKRVALLAAIAAMFMFSSVKHLHKNWEDTKLCCSSSKATIWKPVIREECCWKLSLTIPQKNAQEQWSWEQWSCTLFKKEEGELRSCVTSSNVNKRVVHRSTWFLFECREMEGMLEFSDYYLGLHCGGRSLSCLDDKVTSF